MQERDLTYYITPRPDGELPRDTWLSSIAQRSPPSPMFVVNVLRSILDAPNGIVGVVWGDTWCEHFDDAPLPRFSDAHDFDDAVARLVTDGLVEDLGPTTREECPRAWGMGVRGGMGAGTSTVRAWHVQVRRYQLTSLGRQVQAHWLEHNPKTGEARWRCTECRCFTPRKKAHTVLCDYCMEESR